MAYDRAEAMIIHPFHAFLVAAAVPLFLGALLSDWAYSSSYQIQWANFSSWLIAGGLLFAGLALLWGIIDFFRVGPGARKRSLLYLAVLLATFLLGFVNALVHAKDAWAAMPMGLILSVIVTLLAIAAVWIGFTRVDRREVA